MEYHKTKDIIHVKQVLGHRHIENTMIYINLECAVFKTSADQFTVRVAKTPEEIKKFLEVGFDFVCEKDGLHFLRKRH